MCTDCTISIAALAAAPHPFLSAGALWLADLKSIERVEAHWMTELNRT